ncbi:hypothetical protein N008_03975 [Hymenobacter sp. APR13]|nr:hypothetical protein N008_03975 [Hymenobacter sp. APR13]
MEIIIVDDASHDASIAVIEGWLAENSALNARLIALPVNKGLCHVCNTFVRESKGKYCTLIGSDDIYLPNKLATQVPVLEAAGPEAGVVFSDLSKIDPQGNTIVASIYDSGQIIPAEGDVWLSLLRANFIGTMTTLVRRSSLEKVGPYDESLVYEDWDMWLRLSRVCKFIYQPEVTALYRIHGNSFMHKRYRQIVESNMRILSKHLGVSAEADAIIGKHFAQYSEELYRLGSTESVRWLKERRRLFPDRRGLALLWLAKLGIPANALVRANAVVSQLVGKPRKENEAV